MQVVMKSLEEIQPYSKNAKKHDARQIKNVAESIKQYGFVQPVVVDKNNIIVIGHCRALAAKKLGIKEVPCVCVDDLTPEQVNALRLVDNKSNESDWDFDLLKDELPELDLSAFDFDWGISDDITEEVEEDEAPEVDEVSDPVTKRGDIWQLGRHRLMCGDSTIPADVKKLIGADEIDLLLTDPPYGISIVNKTSKKVGGGGETHFGTDAAKKYVEATKYREVLNDNTTETAKQACGIALSLTKNQIVFGGNYFTDFLPPSPCWCVWDKENTGNFADCELAWTSFQRAAKLYKWLWNGLCRKGTRNIEGAKRVHPTQKPVGLITDILRDFSEEKNKVLDLFGGSGSTLIACEQINRSCYMMEYEEYYCDVIVKRWETLTGNRAVLLNDD